MVKKKHIVTYIILISYSFISLYPMIWMAFYSLKSNEEIFVTNPFGPPQNPMWENYTNAVTAFNLPVYFKNSIIVAVFSIIFGVLFALMFTYVCARVKSRLTKILRLLVMAGMFIPIQAVMIPLVVMVRKLGLSNSYLSLIVPYMALNFPFAVMVLYNFYITLPIELEEAAYAEGAGFVYTFFKIILPQMKGIISVIVIYQFMSSWNEFSLALILVTKDAMKTLPLGLAGFYGQYSTSWGLVGAALVIASAPVILVYTVFSNQISDAMSYSGTKG
mgnify:CR=1 FL=1